MHHFNSSDFKNFSKVYRLNLINSVTGYKSANLIGSQSLEGKENLAIFIKECVENNNLSFAFPSQSIYIENNNNSVPV